MLRIIEIFNNLPMCLEVDPTARFQPGQIGALKIKGGKPMVGVCDGLHPCGILDDIKSDIVRALPKPPTQVHVVPAGYCSSFDEDKKEVVLTQDCKVELNHANIIAASFVSSVPGHLQAVNGIFTLPKGTVCNYSLIPSINGNHINDAVLFSCRYAYNIPNAIMEDSTIGSGRVTVWNKNMIAETDMYDTAQTYHTYTPLYVQHGLLTTKRLDYTCPCIGVVLATPDANNSMLRFLLDLEGKIDIGRESPLDLANPLKVAVSRP